MQYITTHPKIMSGQPVIRGTRIPIVRIVYLLKQGHDLTDIHNQYPHVERTILEGALEELAQSIESSWYAEKIAQI